MPIQIIDNFELSVPKPIDNRIVVGPTYTYKNKNSVPLPYPGMRIYDLNDNTAYVYRSGSWTIEVDKISVTIDNSSSNLSYLTFVSGTSGAQSLKVSTTRLKYYANTGQLLLTGVSSVDNPSISFTGDVYYPFVLDEFGEPLLFGTGVQRYLGIYKIDIYTLGVAINGTNTFRFYSDKSQSIGRFNVIGETVNTSRGNGTLTIANSTGVFSEFNYGGNGGNASKLLIYTPSPSQIFTGYSGTTPETTALEFYNQPSKSTYKVRDRHYIGTESKKGFLSIGPVADTLGTFLFHMEDRVISETGFDSNGAGLLIKGQLKVESASRLLGNLSLGTGESSTTGRVFIPNGSESSPSLAFHANSGKIGIYTGGESGNLNWWESGITFVINQNNTTGTSIGRRFRIKGGGSSGNFATDFVFYSNSFKEKGLTLTVYDGDSSNLATPGFVQFISSGLSYIYWAGQSSFDIASSLTVNGQLSVMGSNIIRVNNTNSNYSSPSIIFSNNSSTDYGFGLYRNSSEIGISTSNMWRIKLSSSSFNMNYHSGTSLYGTGTEPSLASGRYTPVSSTRINVSITDASDISDASWLRVGNVITVTGRVKISISGSVNSCSFSLNIPVPANFTLSGTTYNALYRLNGIGVLTDSNSYESNGNPVNSSSSPGVVLCSISGVNESGAKARFNIKTSINTISGGFIGVLQYQYQYCTDYGPEIPLEIISGGFEDPGFG